MSDDSVSRSLRRSLCETNIITLAISLVPVARRGYADESQPTDSTKDLTKAVLRLLSNIVYKCEECQDQFRTSGALAIVLSHCGTDFANPFAREWALFCIRNACENNQENLAFIHSLKPQEVLQDDSLQAQGIKVTLDPQTGKFAFSEDPK